VAGEVEFPTLTKVAHPSVLSYDPATGIVNYMDAPGGGGSSYAEGFLSADLIFRDDPTIVMSVPLTAGKYVFTFSLIYSDTQGPTQLQQWLQYDNTVIGGVSSCNHTGSTGNYVYQHHVANLNLDVARTIKIYSNVYGPLNNTIHAATNTIPLTKSGWNYLKVA
jgi:hypothetical protein